MVIVGARNIPCSSQFPRHRLLHYSGPIVLVNQYQFCTRLRNVSFVGIVVFKLRAGVPGDGGATGGPFVHVMLVGPCLWRAVPGGVGSSAQSPSGEGSAHTGRTRRGSNQPPGSSVGKRKERGRSRDQSFATGI